MLDSYEVQEIEPAPTKGEEIEVIEAEAIGIKDTPSLLPYLLGGAVLGYLVLKI